MESSAGFVQVNDTQQLCFERTEVSWGVLENWHKAERIDVIQANANGSYCLGLSMHYYMMTQHNEWLSRKNQANDLQIDESYIPCLFLSASFGKKLSDT